MNITPKTVDFAIHRLLVGHQVTHGCSFPLKQLVAVWPETLLRRGDLIMGLEGLRRSGHLAIEQTPDGPMVRLINEEFGLVRTSQDREAIAVLNRLRDSRRPQSHLSGLVASLRAGRRPGDGSSTSAD